MTGVRFAGILIAICGVAVNLLFDSEVSDITDAIFIGLGIGIILTGHFGKIKE